MLNMSTAPYNDDFDPNKNFHRILFTPGAAVQARELTQSQTILQDQISKFASSIFSQNTPISGGKITTNFQCEYIKLNLTYKSSNITASDFENKIITNSTGTILAKVLATVEATDPSSPAGDPPTLIVSYISGVKFSDNMEIFPTDGTNIGATTIGTTGGTTSIGSSSVASISSGVFYVVNGYNTSNIPNADGSYSKYSIGNFVSVAQQTTILDKYGSAPSFRVGLQIEESIVDYIDDPSLLDPAVGASSYQAPGADRYSIKLNLTSLPLTVGNDDGFIELLRVKDGSIVKQVDSTVYSTIDDYFAKRTYDTNGDYIVNQFKLTPAPNSANSSKFDIGISKGVAYVRGYRLENQSSITVTDDRARATETLINNNVSIDYGNFFYVNSVKGSTTGTFQITTMPVVDFHSVPLANVVTTNATTYNSTLVGSGRIRNLDFDHYSDSASNTASYIFRAAVSDIQTNLLSSNAFSATESTIQFYDPTGKFSSANNAYVGVILSIDSGSSISDRRKITAYDGSTKTATVSPNFSTVPTGSNFSLRFEVKDIETLVSANDTFGILSSANIDNLSKTSNLASGDTILQDVGFPELLFTVGNQYLQGLTGASYHSKNYFRNKAFTTTTGGVECQVQFDASDINVLDFTGRTGVALSASEILNYFTIFVRNKGSNGSLTDGQILDFTSAGRTVTISASKNIVTFFASDLVATTAFTVDVIAKVDVNNADDTNHIVKFKNLITAVSSVATGTGGTVVNTNTYVDLTNGQVYIANAGLVSPGAKQSLYISDVKRIVKIIDTGSPATAPTVGMFSSSAYDITSKYIFSTGQTDSYYDHASITLKPGAAQPKGNILILLDYYDVGGGDGYFCLKSYLNSAKPEDYIQIPTYTSTNSGYTYALRDCLDFRPTRVNATTSFTFRYTNSDIINTDTGIYLPDNLSQFLSDYSYYLARKDLLILTKDRNFQIIQGVSSSNPVFPDQPEGSLLVAKLTLDPYTGYIPGENPTGTLPNLSLELIQHKRWTMQDISDLQTRVNNLEYYTALNALELKASSTQVPDVNGLNRFKNGILVDDFSSFSTADTSNIAWSASINKRTKQLSALQHISNFPLQNPYVVKALRRLASGLTDYKVNTVNGTTNLFSLPYVSANVLTQQLASNTVNLNPFAVTITQGILELNPPMDNWVDNTKAPDLLIVDPSLQIYQQTDTVNVLSAGDWKVVPGTTQTTTTTNTSTSTNPFGARTTTTETTTQTIADVSQTNTLGQYQQLNNTYNLNNNYITDISILPYIRAQEILIRAKGLLINTPVTASFDGIIVNDLMVNTDTIELSSITGEFKENDVIGYTDENVFTPIARVVAVHNYGDANTRLYVTGNFNTNYYTLDGLSNPTIQSVTYDLNGAVSAINATGIAPSKDIIDTHVAGKIISVGGGFLDASANTVQYHRVIPSSKFDNFVAKYGIWGSPKGLGNLPVGKFNIEVFETKTYFMRWAVYSHQTGFIKINGTSVVDITPLSYTLATDTSITLNAGVNTIEFSLTTTGSDDGNAFFAAAIADAAWTGTSTNSVSGGNIIFATDSINGNSAPLNTATKTTLPGENGFSTGLYYTGVTQVALSGIASSVDDFYTGKTITFTTKSISKDTDGNLLPVKNEVYVANVISYVANTKTVMLDTPINLSFGYNQLTNTDTTSTYAISGGELGRTLKTDEAGTFTAIFRIPEGTFKTGDRVFRIDNRTVATDPASATTFAEGTFTASGLATKSQALNFGPSISGASGTFTRTDVRTNQTISSRTDIRRTVTNTDPVAQSFILDRDAYPNGVFLESVDLFFQSKPTDTNSPVRLSIVPTINGYPGGDVLDYSIVSLTADQINVSANPHYLDPTAKTTFRFHAPVYVQSGVLYAIILKSPSSDYNVYLAAQNAIAIPSTAKENYTDATPTIVTKIGAVPSVGGLFESQNGMTWTAEQSKTLMMVINRCVFDITKTPIIPFGIPKNLPYRKSTSDDIHSLVDPNNVSALTNQVSGKDVIYDALNITTTDFTPTTTNISYDYITTLASNHTPTVQLPVSPGKYACPSYDDIYLNDGLGERILLANSNSSFSLKATLTSSDDAVSPIIADDGLTLFSIKWDINNLELSNNQIVVANTGSGYNTGTPNANVVISAPDLAGGSQAYASANVVGGIVDYVYITNPGSGYLNPPTITITGANTYPALVNVFSEFSPRGGNAACKYFTKKVVLAAGNDSQDLRVFYTAYKPQGTNIYVFCKLLNSNDPTKFDDNEWILLTNIGQNKNIVSKTRTDLYEFVAAPGSNGVADNFITYTNISGQSYNSYIQFAIKIIMTTNDNTSVPFLTDIRALALPSGTGI